MESDIFGKWLTDIDKEMTEEKKKILMFVDNCTAHEDLPKFKNTKIELVPSNMAFKLQPID